MFSLLLYMSLIGLSAPTDATPPELAILVHARVSRVVPQGDRSQTNTFVITHVYLGESGLLGQTFEVRCYRRQYLEARLEQPMQLAIAAAEYPSPHSRPGQTLYFNPPMRKGEEGIWWLRKGAPNGCLVPYYPPFPDPPALATPTPARKVLDPFRYTFRYRDALQWARTVEKINGSSAEQRVVLLKEHCASDNRHVAAWCVRVLAKHHSSAILAFLRDLPLNKDSSVSAQVAVDDVLMAIDAPRWRDSKERRDLLERWVSGEIGDDDDYSLMSDYLRYALRRKQLDWPTWLPLFLRIEEVNTRLSLCCGSWLDPLREPTQEAKKARHFVFTSFLEEIKKTRGHRREVVAGKLGHLYPLQIGELATIDALARLTSDDDLVSILKTIRQASELRRLPDEHRKAPSARQKQ